MKTLKIATIVLALAACGGKKSADTGGGSGSGSAANPPMTGSGSGSGSADSGSGSGSAMAGSGSGSGSAAMASPVDIPTEEDFEDEASQKITEANVDDSVKQIEQDLQITQ